jgi:large repetitive protein
VYGNTKVTLDGRASYSPNIGSFIVAYQWTQPSLGVPVLLSGANTASPTFTARTIPTDSTVLRFSLRVMDAHSS